MIKIKLSDAAQADELMSQSTASLIPLITEYKKEEPIELSQLTPNQQEDFNKLQRANVFLENVGASFNSAFSKAWQYSDEKSKEQLKSYLDSKGTNKSLHGTCQKAYLLWKFSCIF